MRGRMAASRVGRCPASRAHPPIRSRGYVPVSIQQRTETAATSANGGDDIPLGEGLEALAREYGNRFLLEPAPDHELPEHGLRPVDAMRLIAGDLVLDGI